MPHRLYRQVAARAGYRCEYCRAPEVVSPDRFQVEHIRPRARGGTDDVPNLALSCSTCNRRKSQAVYARDPETGTIVAIFDPRRDAWEAHFRIRPISAGISIFGLTPTGRATVERLVMNDDHAVRARSLWVLLDLFPS